MGGIEPFLYLFSGFLGVRLLLPSGPSCSSASRSLSIRDCSWADRERSELVVAGRVSGLA